MEAWRALPEPRPELCLFGIEPELADEPGIRYVDAPSDEEVNRLFNEATVFVQTSTHEGFCLPPLESMATGGAVVCTDAHGNRDFCCDGENCLMPQPDADAVAPRSRRLLPTRRCGRRLGQAGIATAAEYAWARRIDELERFLTRSPRRAGSQPRPMSSPSARWRRATADRTPTMKTELRRPTCAARSAGATARCACSPASPTQREVRSGTLRCSALRRRAAGPPRRRAAHADPPEHVEREAAGLERFARPDARRRLAPGDDPRSCPTSTTATGTSRAPRSSSSRTRYPSVPGESLLDVGSNTCWASNFFAVRGLEVIALDISLWELQGLYTAD